MFSHVTLGASDFDKAGAFYDAVMATLGHSQMFRFDDAIAYGEAAGPKLFILKPFDKGAVQPGNGVHAAFIAPDRKSVDAFHAAAMAHGGSDEGAPGLRPHYHPNYYGAYVRDPDGNKIQAVCHRKEG